MADENGPAHGPVPLPVGAAGPGLRTARPGVPRPGSAHPGAFERLHVAARLEDRFDRGLARLLRRRGWSVRVEPYAGYGAVGWVRVLARTMLAAPGVRTDDLPGAGGAEQAGSTRAPTLRGWRSYATAQVAGVPLLVRVGTIEHHVHTDRGGYLDIRLRSDLPPGWHDVEIVVLEDSAEGVVRACAPVHVTHPDARWGLVSDIDDTVMVTRLPRPVVAAWNILVRHEHAREPVPGMRDLYAALLDEHPGAPVVYLSTGAWNAAPAIGRFLHRNGFPSGPLLLTDWGPTNTGWFRSGPRHKITQLKRLMHELPDVRWVLVGDDGQQDPRIYAAAAGARPDRVAGILVRQLTFTEHVLARGLIAAAPGGGPSGSRTSAGVPVLQGADGHALLRRIEAGGLSLE
ncbi:App1 family protein [Cellulomonas composti]|uniref:Phosphatidate phosphatase APP1 catalytic domain-containing protein n=1 Tax=Cellulomonas composti TaxID=266130 RepID=A0A511J6E9_9CELL|nr:phosphatase domain-containing protein [Cellulomonas composti]GEL93567.1 hypothetical protein CCO02nite_02250 [Cellulomonas composti]